jgi:hypothetical protein
VRQPPAEGALAVSNKDQTRPGYFFQHDWLYECEGCALVQVLFPPTLQRLTDYYAVDYRKGCFAGADVADVTTFPLDNLFYYDRGQSIADLVTPYLKAPALTGQAPRILDIC